MIDAVKSDVFQNHVCWKSGLALLNSMRFDVIEISPCLIRPLYSWSMIWFDLIREQIAPWISLFIKSLQKTWIKPLEICGLLYNMLSASPFWSLKLLDPTDFHCMNKIGWDIHQNIFLCVIQKKEMFAMPRGRVNDVFIFWLTIFLRNCHDFD